MTWQTKTDALAPHAGGVSLSRLSGLPEWLRSNLFLQADRGRLTWRHILAGVLFVAAGAAVSLARTAGPGALNSTWIEDAGNFLQDGLHQSVLTTLTTQMAFDSQTAGGGDGGGVLLTDWIKQLVDNGTVTNVGPP